MRTIWKVAGGIGIVAGTFAAGSAVGTTGAETELQGEMVGYDELVNEKKLLEEELADMLETNEQTASELSDLQDELADAMKVMDERELVQSDLESLQEELNAVEETLESELTAGREDIAEQLEEENEKLTSLQSEISELDEVLLSKQDELAQLEGDILKAAGQPVELTAGQFIVGMDVPPGRYQATNLGEGSNFIVYSASGDLLVNTILGDSIVGSGDYVFFASEGDQVETHEAVRLVPVE
ncbi:hypothetical protein [Jeotgalibacillus haloalkalitolerans]|uniref:Uncharacterized protein n=1 Tax=Jeotgalibacillus haloalkalitolerans TaxID=3104292 RepID=A0ABU5KJG5_9BACL|nr:hypothetical protein [Jeotgalibacillus sp. HH7-29]MDZ5711402.1 hypothetical protein [Jeotgalibacillus sp. HH7-29]